MPLFFSESSDPLDQDQVNSLQNSDDLGWTNNEPGMSEDYPLDFEAFYTLATPAPTAASQSNIATKFSIHGNQTRLEPNDSDGEIDKIANINNDDDLAQLEAWLRSGKVNIVSKLP